MVKIMFVCHGNICRSPMAEFLLKDLVQKKGEEALFEIRSSATHNDELGSPVHYGTKKILGRLNISCSGKYAVKLTASDYDKYDYFIGMDERNVYNMLRLFNGDKDNKVKLLMSFTGVSRDVLDPWWTGNFEDTFKDVSLGVLALYDYLKENGKI